MAQSLRCGPGGAHVGSDRDPWGARGRTVREAEEGEMLSVVKRTCIDFKTGIGGRGGRGGKDKSRRKLCHIASA